MKVIFVAHNLTEPFNMKMLIAKTMALNEKYQVPCKIELCSRFLILTA